MMVIKFVKLEFLNKVFENPDQINPINPINLINLINQSIDSFRFSTTILPTSSS